MTEKGPVGASMKCPVRWRVTALAGGMAWVLAGCAVPSASGEQPPLTPPSRWQAPVPAANADQPDSRATLQHWWRQFNDPVLDRLLAQALADSPTLAQAWTRIERARAALQTAQSQGLPVLNASVAAARNQSAGTNGLAVPIQNVRQAGWDAGWELDLWGRVRQQATAAQARVQARAADWHGARVSLSVELADAYFQYRSCGRLVQVQQRERQSMAQTERVTAAAVQAGFSAPADAALARAGLASAETALVSQQTQCEWWVKSLVALTGLDEPVLREWLQAGVAAGLPTQVSLVPSVPAQVLQQRPDLAALQEELLATAAEVGVARADLYPRLALSGVFTVSASSLLSSSVTSWSLGPALSLAVFDGGRRRSVVVASEAAYDAAWASYRQGVRSAVKEVEQALVQLDGSARRLEQAAIATREYRRFFEATESNWRAGGVDLLTLEQSRRQALSAEVNEIALGRERLQYWMALYKALGGGWQVGDPVLPPAERAEAPQNSSRGVP